MATLYMVGLGLGPGDLTREALEILGKVRFIFVERYTSRAPHVDVVIKYRPDAKILSRRELEDEGGRIIIESLRTGYDVALFVIGDPMLATTHDSLVVSVRRLGFPVKIINSVSIVCASLSQAGLSPYKLGPVATITYPRLGVLSNRALRVLRNNLKRGLHTLLLLDVNDNGELMSAEEGVNILRKLNEEYPVINEDLLIMYLARVGWPNQRIVVSNIKVVPDLGEPPHSILVPGYMDPVEVEYMIHVLGAHDVAVKSHLNYVKRLMGDTPPE